MERKTRPNRFTEALGENVDSTFKKLASEILKDGALSLKEKSLIAVACAIAVGCDNCTRVHQKQALKLGATQKEIMEAAAVAGLVRMGSGFNTAYALLDDHQTVKSSRFAKLGNEKTSVNHNKIIDDKKQENDTEEDKKEAMPTREPDGYITNFYDNNSSNSMKK